MALSRAEIQRNYRERKKQKEGDKYLAKERARQKRNYVPVASLSKSARKKRNMNIKDRVQKHRRKKRADERDIETDDSSGYETTSNTPDHSLLVVKLPSARRKGPRKRVAKALSSAHRNIEKLASENETLKRRVKTTQRRVQRMRGKNKCLTPKSKTDKMMKSLRLKHKNKHTEHVRRQLLLSNVVAQEVKANVKSASPRKKRSIYGTIAGNLVLKYRCISRLSETLKLNRNVVSKVIKEGVGKVKDRKRTQMKYRESVVNFLEREDNCRVNPGKKDAVKCQEGKVQTKVLTDYLDNLYQKYCSENPDAKLSLATFKRMRPKYILTTNCLSRNTCLCTKHQNFSFKLKMLKNAGLATTCNAEDFVRQDMTVDCTKLPEDVTFSTWKRVPVKDGKKKMKIVQDEMKRIDFIRVWEKAVEDFRDHVRRLQKQYTEIRTLKQSLPVGEVVLHMDFAENYSCKTTDEIQSAYWNQSQVTLHPIVLYYRDKTTSSLEHKSFVAVSDCLIHASSTVIAILEEFYALNIPEMQNIKHAHYWTYSPTSQYRNRYIFDTILNHNNIFACKATWNYFEAGHGKGPCDGVGGTTKRMADEAVNAQKATIQDADDFYCWAKNSKSVKGITFFFVSKDKCEKKASDLQSCKLQPVKGTMSFHACKCDNNILLTGNTSCYCDKCMQGNTCENWGVAAATLIDDKQTRTQEVVRRGSSDNSSTSFEALSTTFAEGDFVATTYMNNWFVGKILQVDKTDNEFEVSFMKQKKNMFQWPPSEDILWVTHDDIMCKIKTPIPSGKSARMYRVERDDMERIEQLFREK